MSSPRSTPAVAWKTRHVDTATQVRTEHVSEQSRSDSEGGGPQEGTNTKTHPAQLGWQTRAVFN